MLILLVVVVIEPELLLVSTFRLEEYILTLPPMVSFSSTFLDIPACKTPNMSAFIIAWEIENDLLKKGSLP